jgi:hypothetical protein|tara:strand:+ start:257 stop:472 length:216 start_codon:yes stop_codon:yes gene_type:complete
MQTESDNVVIIAALVVGILILVWAGYGLVTTTTENATECAPVCVIEGVQYKPMPHGGECWCDMKKGRALTD